MNTISLRQIAKIATAKPFSHGTGFQAYSIGQQSLGSSIHPFLQLDHYFMSQPTFGAHPHQGIAAVTYMFEDSEGSFFNQDSQGDRSYIHPGDLHWTQAGSGVTHDETPTEPGKVCHGIQMFVDLPAADKVAPAQAFHLLAQDIPTYETPDGGRVRVVIGNANGIASPLQVSSSINFLDVTVPANQTIVHELPDNQSAFLMVIQGSGVIAGTPQMIQPQTAVLFESSGQQIQLKATEQNLQYILCIR